MLKVCSCCLRSRPKSAYRQEQWRSVKIRQCNECAAANKPIMNPDIQGTVPLPAPGEGKRLFACADIAKDIVPDINGQLHLVLGGGEDARNTCRLCGKKSSTLENGKSKLFPACARCKKVAYCSKECQVNDWKRHRREECIRKDSSKVEILGKIEPEEGKVAAAYEKIYDGLKQIALDENKKRLPSWEKYRDKTVGDTPTETMKKASLDFQMRFYPLLSSFAAYHIERYYPLKGALFIFSKVSFDDLTDVPRDIRKMTSSPLDRMFAVAWGCLPVEGVSNRPHFSAMDLAEKFLDCVTTLPYLMENCCDRDSFPMVMCCDPSGDKLPGIINQNLLFPKNVDPIHYIDETQPTTNVMTVRLFDFDAMLEFAIESKSADMEVKMCTIDRES